MFWGVIITGRVIDMNTMMSQKCIGLIPTHFMKTCAVIKKVLFYFYF